MDDESSDKPFACTENACNLRFATEDHLSIHMNRHKMNLKLNPTVSVHHQIMTDQTPTPSRFLGNFAQQWDAFGLSNDLGEMESPTPVNTNTAKSNASNPFATSFQNALNRRTSGETIKINDINSRNSISDSPLNTPSIIPNIEVTPPIYMTNGLLAIADAALNTHDNDIDYHTPNVLKYNEKRNNEKEMTNLKQINEKNRNDSVESKTLVTRTFQAVPVICNASISNTASAGTLQQITSNSINQIPNIVITQPSVKPNNGSKTKPSNSVREAALIAPKTSKDAPITVGATNSVYKVILRLPDGRSVQLPLAPLQTPQNQPTVVAVANTVGVTNASKADLITSKTPSLLTEHITVQNPISMNSITSQISPTSVTSSVKHTLQDRVDTLSATLAALPPRAKPGRKSKFAPEEDPIEKKSRSLERNRAAAMRCRLKRKHWVDGLEEKADEMEKTNERLQNEVLALRREVSLLKTALLAHKDCPVTLQQTRTIVNDVPLINGDVYKSHGNEIVEIHNS